MDENFPLLLNKSALNIIQSDPIGGVNLVVLHNNEYAILNRLAFMVVKRHIENNHVICRENYFDCTAPDKGSFVSSDYHFEFELTEQSLEYIKGTIKNKPIFNKEFIFVIKNATNIVNRNLYLELRRMIDTSNVARWIITMERCAFLEKSIQSRALMINCCFPLQNILQCCKLPLSIEEYYPIYMKSRGNVVNFIQLVSTSLSSLMWQDNFDKFLQHVVKEKKQINVIHTSREMAYKLYHIGVTFSEFCRYLVIRFGETIQDIIPLIADCEHSCSRNNECLLFERMILEVYKQLHVATNKTKKNSKDKIKDKIKDNSKNKSVETTTKQRKASTKTSIKK